MSSLPKLVQWKDHVRMKFRAWNKKNLPSIMHTIRTAVAATASVIIARLVQMPEAYWAAIATLVVMQATLGATLTLSLDRIVATAVGASIGALEINYFGANLVAFALAIYASITVAITVSSRARLRRGPPRCRGSLKSRSESSLLSPS